VRPPDSRKIMPEEKILHHDLLGHAVRGAAVLVAFAVGGGVIHMAGQITLMRLLSPSVFGQAALVFLLVEACKLVTTIQGPKAIIRESGDVRAVVDTAFTVELCLAVVIAAVLALVAGPLMRLMKEPDLVWQLRAASLALVVVPLTMPRVLFERAMDFRRANTPSIIGIATGTTLGVILALSDAGVWSLVCAVVVGDSVKAGVAWFMAPHRPRLRIHQGIVSRVTRFGLPLSLSSILAYFYWKVDDFMVKLMLGTESLGFYDRAFKYPHYGLRAQSWLSALVYPAFCRSRDDAQMTRGFRMVTKFSALAALLPSALVLVWGREMIEFAFGSVWLPAVVPFQVFTCLVAVRAIFNHWVEVYVTKGKTVMVTLLAGVNSVLILVLGYTFTRLWGITGMAFAVALTILVTISIAVLRMRRTLEVRYRRTLAVPVTIFFITLAVALALNVTSFCPVWCQIALTVAVYAVLVLRLEHGPVGQVAAVLLRRGSDQ
jgi:O-antigen/teichoic acid export membrane protein